MLGLYGKHHPPSDLSDSEDQILRPNADENPPDDPDTGSPYAPAPGTPRAHPRFTTGEPVP